MKRLGWLALLCAVLMMLAVPVSAAALREYAFFDDDSGKPYARCVDYEGELPAEIEGIFSGALREGDQILTASRYSQWWKEKASVVHDSILLAVEREGCIVLMGAFCEESGWSVCVETDSFLQPGTAFSITCVQDDPLNIRTGGGGQAIVCGDERWLLSVERGGWVRLVALVTAKGGGRQVIDMHLLSLFIPRDGQESAQKFGPCCMPSRLSAWRAEDFPRSAEEIERYVSAHQPQLAQGEAYISAVNLREQPTGSSRSLGVYSAKVQVLDSSPGKEYPWYQVRIGETEGWVSGAYLINSSEDVRYYGVEEKTTSFARADGETALRISPGGAQKGVLSPGTMVHVISENEGWLHVLVPEEKIAPRVSWRGTYGYVRSDEVTQGATLAELRWR